MLSSGSEWCEQFLGTNLISDLAEPFRDGVTNFIAALRAASASVQVSATYRPPERAYLMHWAWGIARGLPASMCRPGDTPGFPIPPESVPKMDGVAIDWTCGGDPKLAHSAAWSMVTKYGLKVCAALDSRHIERRAIDMTIRWQGTILVKDASGRDCPASAMADLYPVGATYGVHKLISDPPHWSDNGR